MSLISKAVTILTKYPVTRGMLSYSIIWPSGCFLQQLWFNEDDHINWKRCFRFLIYGGFFVAPTLYAWVRISSVMFPDAGLKSALAKVVIEQLSYTPFAMTCFYFGMSLMEGNTLRDSFGEVASKFVPTYKVSELLYLRNDQ